MSHEFIESAITTIDVFARFIRPVNAKKVERLRADFDRGD